MCRYDTLKSEGGRVGCIMHEFLNEEYEGHGPEPLLSSRLFEGSQIQQHIGNINLVQPS